MLKLWGGGESLHGQLKLVCGMVHGRRELKMDLPPLDLDCVSITDGTPRKYICLIKRILYTLTFM